MAGASQEGPGGLLLNAQGQLVPASTATRRMAAMDAPLSAPAAQFTTLPTAGRGK
ncbi:MAG: hypothetical protein R3B47_06855 [Bacteroidia bacterium]